MSVEIDAMYTSLVQDADGLTLSPPDLLRKRGDRRARNRVSMGVAAAVLAVTALATGISLAQGQEPSPPVGSTAPGLPSASPSGPPSSPTPVTTSPSKASPTATDGPSSIPTSAFLTKGDLNAVAGPNDESVPRVIYPLCGKTFPSDTGKITSRSRTSTANLGSNDRPRPNEYTQSIVSYRAGRATDFMRELRAAVSSCRNELAYNGKPVSYKLLSGTKYGDETVWIERSYEDAPIEGAEAVRVVRTQAVVRVGPVIVVIDDGGWESGPSHVDYQGSLTGKAVDRVRSWLD
jgi:hypothetical protein